MHAIHMPHLPRLDLHGKNRTRLLVVLAALVTAVLVLVVSASTASTQAPATNNGGTGAGQALPAATDPAPPPDKEAGAPEVSPSSPAPSKAPAATKSTVPLTKPATPPASKPALSKTDKEALGIVGYWWDTFVLAAKSSKNAKFTTAQLRKPEVVIVSKSSCKQPKTNLLGPKSRTSFTYCNGKLELVPKVFMTITEMGQLRVVASGFLYHAQDVAPDAQRKGGSNDELLGALQARLAIALVDYQATGAYEDAWVVIQPDRSAGEDVDWGYAAVMESSGR